MNRMVKCIKKFIVQECDGDGFEIRDKYKEIKKDSIWELDCVIFNTDAIRLFSESDNYSLEISKEDYEELFEKVEVI